MVSVAVSVFVLFVLCMFVVFFSFPKSKEEQQMDDEEQTTFLRNWEKERQKNQK